MTTMPRALALETSGRIGSVALAEDGELVAEEQFPHGLQHAARIITVIDSLCRGAGWKPGDIEELYVSIGPGSFTGLRIGITAAKTLAMATGVKLVGVPSVRVLAENAPREARNVIIVLDAKRGQIFTARFERAGDESHEDDWMEVEPAHLDTLAGMLTRSPRPVFLLGEGLPFHIGSPSQTEPGVIPTASTAWQARASVVAHLGWQLARAGQFADPLTLSPLYVRPPEAQEKFEAASGA
jgi:tRNA threonylcarbamoyladenosine biosynthesis protein TsaB